MKNDKPLGIPVSRLQPLVGEARTGCISAATGCGLTTLLCQMGGVWASAGFNGAILYREGSHEALEALIDLQTGDVRNVAPRLRSRRWLPGERLRDLVSELCQAGPLGFLLVDGMPHLTELGQARSSVLNGTLDAAWSLAFEFDLNVWVGYEGGSYLDIKPPYSDADLPEGLDCALSLNRERVVACTKTRHGVPGSVALKLNLVSRLFS